MPRVAALKNVSQISDVIKILDQNTFQRPIYAGNAFATVQSQESLKIITVRSTAFDPYEQKSDKSNEIVRSPLSAVSANRHFLSIIAPDAPKVGGIPVAVDVKGALSCPQRR